MSFFIYLGSMDFLKDDRSAWITLSLNQEKASLRAIYFKKEPV